jgi:sugar/nucleoside kinase (ribokinase family)
VIVVIGPLVYRATDTEPAADGLAAQVAFTAAGLGRSVQLVGKIGEDPEGDAVLLALARGGVGHVAMLRDAGMATPRAAVPVDDETAEPAGALQTVSATVGFDAGDIELALRYLTDFSVLVLAVPANPDIARVVAAAAGWGDARLILIVATADGLPADAIVFEAPDTDPDGVFAAMVGSFAAALDDGSEPAAAFRASVEGAGWTPAPND